MTVWYLVFLFFSVNGDPSTMSWATSSYGTCASLLMSMRFSSAPAAPVSGTWVSQSSAPVVAFCAVGDPALKVSPLPVPPMPTP